MSRPVLDVRLTNYYAVRDQLAAKGRLYRGAFRDTIKRMLLIFRNYAHFITHRETGTLARAHQIYYNARRLQGHVYIDEGYSKIRYGRTQYPSEYGAYEHSRGGDHADHYHHPRCRSRLGHHSHP